MSDLLPCDHILNHYPVTGVVSQYDVVSAPEWRRIARGSLPNIGVQLEEPMHYYLNESVKKLPVIECFGGSMPELPRVLTVPLSMSKRQDYPIGSVVEVVIGYVRTACQNAERRKPLEATECTVLVKPPLYIVPVSI